MSDGSTLSDIQLLRPAEVARVLSISRPEVYKLIAAGVIPAVRLGPRCLRIPRRALEQRLHQLIEEQNGDGEVHA
jgi:excisionase family DNA binding protein